MARFKRLSRLFHRSAWRFLALIATAPELDRLYETLRRVNGRKYLDAPTPWLAFDAVDYLDSSISPGAHILEWGAGASTLWFLNKQCIVRSIEHDRHWYEQIRKRIAPPSQIELPVSDESYCAPDCDLRKFDVVVIDGRHRVRCAEFVIRMLEQGHCRSGLTLVFDDAQRPQYRDAIERLRKFSRSSEFFSEPSGYPLHKVTAVFGF